MINLYINKFKVYISRMMNLKYILTIINNNELYNITLL